MFPVTSLGEPAPAYRSATVHNSDGRSAWLIPEETPVAFVYNRRNYAVMMATPADLVDFSVGFSITEGVVDSVQDIVSLEIFHAEAGVDLRIRIADSYLDRLELRQRRRNLIGAAGCGICGVENREEFFTNLPRVAQIRTVLDPAAVATAMKSLPKVQPLNCITHSVHAAAWVTLKGEIILVREDVGRHNAVDKLLGALALKSAEMADGFVLMSSRCSYEIVEKAARRGVRAIASISAPTAFAAAKAREANIALYARSGKGVIEITF